MGLSFLMACSMELWDFSVIMLIASIKSSVFIFRIQNQVFIK
jgi:hypothetical protein